MSERAQAPFHILVVDDEPDVEPLIRQRMRRHVRAGKYALHFAGNGAEALEILAEDNRIDMVVTDINMPKMDGLALLSEIPKLDPDTKSIVVSAYGDMSNIRTAMNRGAFDFVTKPLDFNDFEVTIERTQGHIARWKDALRSRDRLTALQRELELANHMQQAILPVDFPSNRDFNVHGSMVPAKNVGGDFFDVVMLEHGQIGLAVADVSDTRDAPRVAARDRSACRIKGNINHNSGRRIYHVPGDRDYERTRISRSRGERYFCTEAAARGRLAASGAVTARTLRNSTSATYRVPMSSPTCSRIPSSIPRRRNARRAWSSIYAIQAPRAFSIMLQLIRHEAR